MAVGDQAKAGVQSYVAFFLESTWGTYPASAATNASTMEPLSFNFKTNIKSELIDSINKNRGFTKRVQLDKEVAGSLEHYMHPIESPRLFAVCLGGGITSTGTSTTGWTHSITAGNFDTNNSSISFNVRKGDAHTWGYTGGRVNTLKISGNVGEIVKASYDFVFKDSTQGITDINASLSISAVLPFTYVQGVYRYQSTEALANTTTAEEPIQGFELTINNNMKTDKDARQLGSNLLSVLPATRRKIELKVMQRWDTTTNWNRFIQATQGSIELVFTGSAITIGTNYQCFIRLPKVFMNSPEPEVPGPNDILKSEINFDVLVDSPSTTTGKDIGVTFINDVSSYAS